MQQLVLVKEVLRRSCVAFVEEVVLRSRNMITKLTSFKIPMDAQDLKEDRGVSGTFTY